MKLYRLETYVPEEAEDAVREALFAAGAGRIGRYERCCWRTAGEGCFRPLAGSRPFLGETDRDEVVREVKLELVVDGAFLKGAVAALKKAHPYETPAYAFWAVNVEEGEDFS